MVLRDFYCTVCGENVRDVMSETASEYLWCENCRKETKHTAHCNGGTGKRFRHHDWPDSRNDPDFYHGQVTSKLEAVTIDDDGTENPVEFCEAAGKGRVDQAPQFSDDRLNERRDKIHSGRKRAAGKNKLYLDRGRMN
jgi:hypothetical protein